MSGKSPFKGAHTAAIQGVLEVADLETTLQASDMDFRKLAEYAPVGIFIDNAEGEAIYINAKCAEMVGVPAEEALNFNWIPHLHPDDRDLMVSTWQNAFETSTAFRLEYRWVHPDGRVVWTLGEVIPILGDDGKAKLYVGTLTDITSQKEAEQEKQALQEKLLQAHKMESIGRLAGGVAHDYNNILSTIIGFAELALDETDKEGIVHSRLEEILKAAFKSAEITRQLLGFARKQSVLPRVFDANQAIGNMQGMLNQLFGEEIAVDWRPWKTPVDINLDAAQFDQIMLNLCINARDAIRGKGKVTIQTAVERVDEEYCAPLKECRIGQFGVISVCDDGIGMDEETIEHMFEPFFSTKEKAVGTGLGLASVHGIVNQADGFAVVESEPGVGTTIKVFFPLYEGN